MVNLLNKYLYAKGTCNVVVRNITTGDVDYQSNKMQTSQFATTCDMGAIQAGIGNATVIQIPHNSAVNLTLTAADFSMSARAMSVGSTVAYGGISPVCEVITAGATALTVTNTPAAPYGYTKAICNVVEAGVTNAPGTAYEIDTQSKTILGFTATNGKSYTVTYFQQNASAEYFNIGGMFAPAIKHVTVQIPIYSASGTENVLQGTKVGDLYIIIPRMQFGGKADIEASQTAAATTDLSGTALTYEEAAAEGVCNDCSIPGLAQVLYVPAASVTASVVGLAVVGGAMTVKSGSSTKVPVKGVMPNGTLQQLDYSTMTYSIAAGGTSIASVNEQGDVSGTSTGDTELTVTLKDNPSIKTTVSVTVTA